jgi:hypothetical protein
VGGGGSALSVNTSGAVSVVSDAVTIAAGAIGQTEIATSGVASAEIADGTIVGADIAAGAIGQTEIATSGVASAEIADGTIVAADIAADTIGAGQIATSGVGNAEIADNAVTSAKIAESTIGAGDLGANSVGDEELFNGGTWNISSSLVLDGSNLRVGAGGAVNQAAGDNDLYVEADLEVDGTLYFGAGGTYQLRPDNTPSALLGLTRVGNLESNNGSAVDVFLTMTQWAGTTSKRVRFSSGTATAANTFVSFDGGTGNVNARGSFNTTASPDVAEYIQAAKDVEAYDLVSISEKQGEVEGIWGERVMVEKAARPYDHRIIGVIADGGSAMNIGAGYRDMDDNVKGGAKPLAIAGRVPVKFSLENGPVRKGDALTSSSKPGYAMKATEAGPTVGIALEDFDGSKGDLGKVLCYINVSERNLSDGMAKLLEENRGLRADLAQLKAQLAGLLVKPGSVRHASGAAEDEKLEAFKVRFLRLEERLRELEKSEQKEHGPRRTKAEGAR